MRIADLSVAPSIPLPTESERDGCGRHVLPLRRGEVAEILNGYRIQRQDHVRLPEHTNVACAKHLVSGRQLGLNTVSAPVYGRAPSIGRAPAGASAPVRAGVRFVVHVPQRLEL